MLTIILWPKDQIYDKDGLVFWTSHDRIQYLRVEKFEDGIVYAKPYLGENIVDYSDFIAECLGDVTNFDDEIKMAFKRNKRIKGIQFEFNGVTVYVTPENADKDKIIKIWETAKAEKDQRAKAEYEAWLKTEEGQQYLAKQREEEMRQKALREKILKIDQEVEMEFNSEESKSGWEEFVRKNSNNFYSNGVVKYARYWAKYMQQLMAEEGKTVAEIAEKASFDADIDSISGYMYGCAVAVLVEFWKYGEELRVWHNSKYGQTGDGVVNPAILTVG